MKNFDLKSSSDLSRFKEELVKILESRIEKAKLSEELDSLNNLTLGGIRNVFEGITEKLYESKEGKRLISKYVKTIRENKSLSDAYSTYEIVYGAPNVTNPELFLNEAISMASKISKKDYEQGKNKIAEIVKEATNLVGADAAYIYECAHRNDKINEGVEYLVLNKKTYSNLPDYVNKFDIVCEALKTGMKPVIEESVSPRELVKKLNEEISGLNDWETEAIKEISLALLSESDLNTIFDKYKNNCIEKLDEAIENSVSKEDASRFESMKEQLTGKEYKKESVYEDIFTLAELSKTLSE